jgi:hypothetical protein
VKAHQQVTLIENSATDVSHSGYIVAQFKQCLHFPPCTTQYACPGFHSTKIDPKGTVKTTAQTMPNFRNADSTVMLRNPSTKAGLTN